ncbi:MAG: hypothetical protein CME70_17565 [Halobacteriovorax sp.]|nr:hypothetical protein [Halobacteriovorax sp.]
MIEQIIIPKAGQSAVLKLSRKEAIKNIAEQEVRVKVVYSGINFADIIMRLGLYQDAPAFPFVPGYELSGEVIEVGSAVTKFKPGDQVMAGTKFNGYSSEVVLPETQVVSIGNLSLEEAAALPVSFLTAYLVFFEEARVRSGDKVLIDCATGALGQLSFQMLKTGGGSDLEIVGLTSSEAKKDIIRSYGAKAMTHEEFRNSDEKDFDIILNSQGGASIKEHYKRLGPTGKLVCIGASSIFESGRRSWFKVIKTVLEFPKFNIIKLMNDNKGVMGLNVLRLFDGPEYLMNILAKVEMFELHPKVDKIFDASEAHMAHQYIEEKKARGKVLLKWS